MRKTVRRGKPLAVLALGACATLVLAACGGSNISNTKTSSGAEACGTFNVAVNPWVGYEADAYVVGDLAQTKLGCNVSYKNLKEEPSWAGFATGSVDVVLENWGHEDLVKKYIDGTHTAETAGQTGNIGVIGWFVPPWLAKAHPDITNWQNLNKYASNFKTSESGSQGQFLDGDPSFVTNDAALIQNLNLNFKVVYAGSEAALITAFRNAEKNHTWVIGYFYSPQWFLAEVPLVQVQLPKFTTGCDSNPDTIKCGYPVYHLDKIVSTKFAQSATPAYNLVKNFHWTNADQNTVAKYIAQDGMSPTDAAQKWIDDNAALAAAWLK
ncbi:MAG: ABC transporter substrate-binding protein [Actinomycetota bacterium]|nr:ABC transporter substrate-binding protein [Actinomycetota bacterium]